MNTELSWKKDIFSRNYTLFNNQKLCGYIKRNLLSQSAIGTINNEVFSFKTNGVFKKNTIVYDMGTYKSLAVITYDELRSRAILSVGNRVLYFKYDNFLQTHWRLDGIAGEHILCSSSLNKGCIDSTTDESILLLSGLLVADYYKESQITVLISLIAVIAVLFIVVF